MQLIFGTKNKAKLIQIKGALAKLPITVEGLPDIDLPDVLEDGKTAMENAKKKAVAFARSINKPVLAMDIGLYFEGLPDDAQPSINVRRFGGRIERATDDEVFDHYLNIVRSLGQKVNGYWEYAICLAYPDGSSREITVVTPRIFVDEPSPVRIEGYPLEAIQIDPQSGRYISEMSQAEQDEFWQRTIGKDLSVFVENNLN